MSIDADKLKTLEFEALACVGKAYEYGAPVSIAPESFDCSSLTQYLYHKIGVDIPRTAIGQAHLGKEVLIDELKLGDLLFFHGYIGHFDPEFPDGIGHVAMYLGNDEAIHATGGVGKVITTSLDDLKHRADLIVIKRIL